jgi:hypothetical protein
MLSALLMTAFDSAASAKVVKLPPAIVNRAFACDGTLTIVGTHIDRREDPEQLILRFGRDVRSVAAPNPFCAADRKCRVHYSAHSIELTVKILMVTESLSFDWQSGVVDLGSGGLDSGQNFHGHCALAKGLSRPVR